MKMYPRSATEKITMSEARYFLRHVDHRGNPEAKQLLREACAALKRGHPTLAADLAWDAGTIAISHPWR
jgi:hypothetical protein